MTFGGLTAGAYQLQCARWAPADYPAVSVPASELTGLLASELNEAPTVQSATATASAATRAPIWRRFPA